MFSFDGDYKRTPLQNLGGVSQNNDRETVIKRAQQERQKRAEIRKQNRGAITIQSAVRSYFIRKNCKEQERQFFNHYYQQYGLTNEEHLNFLIKRILFFYDKDNVEDIERLIIVKQFLLKYPELFFKHAVANVQWQHRIKKLLFLSIQQLSKSNSSISHAIPFRILETFSSKDVVARYIVNTNLQSVYLEDLYKYLIKRKYFTLVRKLIDAKVPTLYDEVLSPPNSISDTLLQMIRHPLKLLQQIDSTTPSIASLNTELANLIVTSFIEEILVPAYTPAVQLFLIPCLANNRDFPFLYLIKRMNDFISDNCEEFTATAFVSGGESSLASTSSTSTSTAATSSASMLYISSPTDGHFEYIFDSSFLLNALLKLDNLHFEPMKQASQFLFWYIRILARLSNTIRKLPRSSAALTYRLSDDEYDVDDYDSDSSTKDNRRLGSNADEITRQEHDVLTEAISLLNDQRRASLIVDNTAMFLSNADVLHSLCKICHNLMLHHRSAIYEYKLLYMLAFQPKFIRALWFILPTKATHSGLSTPLNLIAKGIQIPDTAIEKVIPILATFCTLFSRLIVNLHDGEFCQDNILPGAESKIMPFQLIEIVGISSLLKEISLGLVELAFPEIRKIVNDHYRTILRSGTAYGCGTNSNKSLSDNQTMWSHLLKVCVSLLRQLYTRDLRCGFCPESHWTVQSLNLPLDKPNDLQMPRGRRGPRPFQPIKDFTREDFDTNGPPLSTKQIRSITILREMPFVVPFNTRVGIFQGLLASDRLRAQGDQQIFLLGPSIQIVVRRSHLYEDAFDKLRPENEPDLRPRFRVQMVNDVGLEEAGIDGGGIFREFLSQLIKTSFDPNRGFFKITTDNKLYPNPGVGKIVEDFQKHYYFIGRTLGKALYENLLVELPLADFFLSKLAGKQSDVDVHQLASLDPELHRNLLSLKAYDGDVEELGLDFTVVENELGETNVVDLEPNGSNIGVNASNRIEYISLMADYKLNRQIKQQCAAFRKGLANVINLEWLYMFSNKELQVLISGAEIPVDIEDLRNNAKYGGDFDGNHPTIKIFWEVLTDFDDIQKRQLLKFVTSCSRPPLLGFRDLDPPFCIQNAGDTDRLPSASTCMNLLKLPAFKTRGQMHEKLLYAIQSNAGFELS